MVRKKTPPWYGLSGGPIMVACRRVLIRNGQATIVADFNLIIIIKINNSQSKTVLLVCR